MWEKGVFMKRNKYSFSEFETEYFGNQQNKRNNSHDLVKIGIIQEDTNIYSYGTSHALFFIYCLEGTFQVSTINHNSPKLEGNSTQQQNKIQLYAQQYTYFRTDIGIDFKSLVKNKKVLVLQVDVDYLHKMCHNISLQNEGIILPISLHLQMIFKQIQEHKQTIQSLEFLFYQQKKYELLHAQCLSFLEKEHVCQSSSCEYIAVQKAHDIILQDLSQTPNLKSLAHTVGLSRTRLCMLFKEYYGDTVCGLLRQKRLISAAELLSKNNITITEIAYMCGFSSPSHFTHLFSKYYHVSPKRYKTVLTIS